MAFAQNGFGIWASVTNGFNKPLYKAQRMVVTGIGTPIMMSEFEDPFAKKQEVPAKEDDSKRKLEEQLAAYIEAQVEELGADGNFDAHAEYENFAAPNHEVILRFKINEKHEVLADEEDTPKAKKPHVPRRSFMFKTKTTPKFDGPTFIPFIASVLEEKEENPKTSKAKGQEAKQQQ
ncbi:hypothetical protein K505DRAFT_359583 [Melanomma pulvis-pyrius CBS 109.77]|uniref:Uncharacterized protein n=1 Tax=Melanomma pulvis-pyrius CBS 109.77 TaxID=1314802 RepID=A0A6A6XJ73_9PLEO|nr:hypothetical protein K505DRAFT_359583 [Melanomma pulvis-pyrius CBS 109.77]